MKYIFSSAFLLLVAIAFAQNNDGKKDTNTYEFGERFFDARIGRSMSVDPKQLKENSPYQFAASTKTKQVAYKPKKKNKTSKNK